MPRVISESRSFHLKIICNSYDISRKPLPHWAWRKKPWQSGMIKFIYFEMVFDEISKYYSKVLSIVNFFLEISSNFCGLLRIYELSGNK